MQKRLLFWLFLIGLLAGSSACSSASTPFASCEATAQPNMIEACLLTGYLVKNPQGEFLGQVKGVFVDTEQGQVAYVALAFDDPGLYGKGAMVTSKEKITLVPWAVLTPVAGESVLLLDIDQRRSLVDLPHFDRMPEGVSPELAAQIHEYWAKTEYRP